MHECKHEHECSKWISPGTDRWKCKCHWINQGHWCSVTSREQIRNPPPPRFAFTFAFAYRNGAWCHCEVNVRSTWCFNLRFGEVTVLSWWPQIVDWVVWLGFYVIQASLLFNPLSWLFLPQSFASDMCSVLWSCIIFYGLFFCFVWRITSNAEITSNPTALPGLFCHGQNWSDLSLPSLVAHKLPRGVEVGAEGASHRWKSTLGAVPASVLPPVATSWATGISVVKVCLFVCCCFMS